MKNDKINSFYFQRMVQKIKYFLFAISNCYVAISQILMCLRKIINTGINTRVDTIIKLFIALDSFKNGHFKILKATPGCFSSFYKN